MQFHVWQSLILLIILLVASKNSSNYISQNRNIYNVFEKMRKNKLATLRKLLIF